MTKSLELSCGLQSSRHVLFILTKDVLMYLMHLSGSVNFRFLIHVLFPLYLKTNMDSNGLWGTLRNGKVYTPGMYIGEQGEK